MAIGMFNNLINKLQSQSLSVRRKFLFVAVMVAMIMVVSLWLVFLDSRLSLSARNAEQLAGQEAVGSLDGIIKTKDVLTEKVPSLFSAIKDAFTGVVESFSTQEVDNVNQLPN